MTLPEEAAAYVRKSTDETDVPNDAKSVEIQEKVVLPFIVRKGWKYTKTYKDDGISGARFKTRAEFSAMMQDAAAGRFRHLVVFDLDRLGRDSEKTMAALITLVDLGVTIWDASSGQPVDLDTFEGGTITYIRTRFAQQYREQIRKHTRNALVQRFLGGGAVGGRVYGYDNVGEEKARRRVVNEAQIAIVREIYQRFADGESESSITRNLNRRGVPAPRHKPERPKKWSLSTVRSLLTRKMYRGHDSWGRRAKAYGRELPKELRDREHGMVRRPKETWIHVALPELKVIDDLTIERVDARLAERRARWDASVAKGPARPERAHGRHLLSGGLILCPECGGNYEWRLLPPKSRNPGHGVYRCSTARRRPGACTNTQMLDAESMEEAALSIIEGEILTPDFIDDLLGIVARGPVDESARLKGERDQLNSERERLVGAIRKGIVSEDEAAKDLQDVRDKILTIEKQLNKPRPETPDPGKLRDALEQRQTLWAAELRSNPEFARLIVKRLLDPIVLHDERTMPSWVKELRAVPSSDGKPPKKSRTVKWTAKTKAVGMVDGLATVSRSLGRDGGRRRN
jgi:DNA invertase Pin-like site-specific DNA recombinase